MSTMEAAIRGFLEERSLQARVLSAITKGEDNGLAQPTGRHGMIEEAGLCLGKRRTAIV
jgi:hypothetical protein